MNRTVTFVVGVIIGALLFFLCFGAIFAGSAPLLLLFLTGFFLAGYLLARRSPLSPRAISFSLALPVGPWALQFGVASIPEAGVLRALLWPLGLAMVLALGFLGALVARRRTKSSRHPLLSPPDGES